VAKASLRCELGQALLAAMGSQQECFVEINYSNLGVCPNVEHWANAMGHSNG
jgi:hypothetical protein